MNCVAIVLLALGAVKCDPLISTPAFSPVIEYHVPVAPPVVYAPTVHARVANPYVGAYTVHTTPAVSHSFSQTQTHPVSFVKPVNAYGSHGVTSGQYYAPAATSTVQQSRLIVPQTSHIYRYQSANQPYTNQQYPQARYQIAQANQPGRVYIYRSGKNDNNQRYIIQQSQNGQYNQGFNSFGQQQQQRPQQRQQQQQQQQQNRQVYAGGMPYQSDGEQVKTRRYQIHRPGIQKEFYDVEEHVIIRPVGSALIELDPPIKKVAKYEMTPNRQYGQNYAPQSGQYNSRGFAPPQGQYDGNQNQYAPNQYNNNNQAERNGQYNTHPGHLARQNCDYFITVQTPSGSNAPTQTSSTTNQYPTENGQYSSTSAQTTTANEYPTTTYSPTSTGDYPTTTASSSQSSDIYISSTTPVAVTIVDNASNNQTQQSTPNQDIVYANNNNNNKQQYNNENSPDQFRNELPPRGDLSQYQNEPSDQFYHELPRDRYTNSPANDNNNNNQYPQNVYTKSRGDPSESPAHYEQEAEVIEIDPQANKNVTSSNRNQTSNGNTQQQRLIELYTGNGGISEIGYEVEPNGQYNQYQGEQNGRYTIQNGQNNQYQNGASGQYTTPSGQYQNGASGRYQNEANGRYSASNAQNNNQYQSGANGRYTAPNQNQDVGNVRARVVSVTPPPATAEPSETVNKRRIVVSKPVTTVQEVVEEENKPEIGAKKGNYKSGRNSNQNSNQDYENSAEAQNNQYNANYNADPSSDYDQSFDGNSNENNSNYNNNNQKFNGGSSKTANYNDAGSTEKTNGFYISTTPSTASQRIIYVQPVAQDFAQQKAVEPKNQ